MMTHQELIVDAIGRARLPRPVSTAALLVAFSTGLALGALRGPETLASSTAILALAVASLAIAMVWYWDRINERQERLEAQIQSFLDAATDIARSDYR